MKDSLYVDVPGHPELLLRTETCAVQIRTMQSQPPPVYVVAPGRVYRRETPDADPHSPVFHQVEGLAVDEGITFADLKGTLETFAKALFGEERRGAPRSVVLPVRRAGRGARVSCFVCGGVGCRICGNGWIELLGAGMVHPDVLRELRLRPRAVHGVRLRHRDRPRGAAPLRRSPTSACCSTATCGSWNSSRGRA